MALTKNMRTLIAVLKNMGVAKDDIVAILLMMETDEQADKMVDWLVKNKDRDTTLTDLLMAAGEINPPKEEEYLNE